MKPTVFILVALLCGCGSAPKPESPAPAAAAPPRILLFYPSQELIGRGEKVLICYGVENASAVSIKPAIEQLSPSFNRCFEHTPKVTETYTLRAEGKGGAAVEQSFTVRVEGGSRTPAQKGSGALISMFVPSANVVTAGQQVTLCYQVRAAGELTLTPSPGVALAKPKGCVTVSPTKTTTYVLTAKGDGQTDRDEVTVRVR